MYMSSIYILLISFLLGTSTIFAQKIEIQTKPAHSSDLKFIPASFKPVFENQILIKPYTPQKNVLLTGAGWLLKGLKFRSVVDEFNALPPFDYRGYHPKNFSSFSSNLTKNYFLQKPIRTL